MIQTDFSVFHALEILKTFDTVHLCRTDTQSIPFWDGLCNEIMETAAILSFPEGFAVHHNAG